MSFAYRAPESVTIKGVHATKIWVDMLPVYYTLPQGVDPEDEIKVCLFLSGLSGTKEDMVASFSDYITSRGYVGVFFDHLGHGERSPKAITRLNAAKEEVNALRKQILDTCFGNLYRHGWEILGNGVLDSLRVIDHFRQNFKVTRVVMGGVSMGGDTAVAAAGLSPCLNRLLCFITTPDWLRPGMCDLYTGQPMNPGRADAKSQWFYDQFNPMTHLDRYTRGIDITFACGELDTHIPPENARRFIDTLARNNPAAASRMLIWWNKGEGHTLPPAEKLEGLFDWFLLDNNLPDEE